MFTRSSFARSAVASIAISIVASIAIFFALGMLTTAAAQSGRRAKPAPKPIIVPQPEPEPTPTASAEKVKPAFRVVVGMDKYDSFGSVSLNTYGGVRHSCAQRLREPGWIAAEEASKPMSRSEAVSRAKTEKDSYVVWLRLREDQMSGNQPGTANNAFVEYAMFAPGTGKVVTSGSTYPSRGNKNIILGPTTTGMDGNNNLNKAARDAADRMLEKLRMRLPQP